MIDPPRDPVNELSCLTDAVLFRLIENQLSEEEFARIHRHATQHAPCRRLLADAVRGDALDEGAHKPPSREKSATEHAIAVQSPDADPWTPPMEFDEFRLVRLLGRGAMGVVYLADDTTLHRQVAIKFIAAPHPTKRDQEHFKTEAQAIARLQHPNVVTLFRVGEVVGHAYLVSEYIDGQSLAEAERPMAWRRVLRIGLGLARGLAAAHQQGVLHRDLKPSNVVIRSNDEVKLLDFGLAELRDAVRPAGVCTIAGTPRYMAPEIRRGESATAQSDIYSLGLALYELCTGDIPHREVQGPAPPAPVLALAPAVALPLSAKHPLAETVPGIDPDFIRIIEHCLRSEPAERYASAEALAKDLERLAEDIAYRAFRQSIEAASAEWERSGRRNEDLWSARQVEEAMPLDPSALSPREQAFLTASLRAARRRRFMRWLAVLLVLMLAGVTYAGLRLQAYLTQRRLIAAHIQDAQKERARGAAHGTRATRLAHQAFALFDGKTRPAIAAKAWDEAEAVWATALEQRKQAEAAYTRADHALQRALLRDSDHAGIRRQLVELTYDRILLDEEFHLPKREELWQQLARLDGDGQGIKRLEAPGALRVESEPAGAHVSLRRYVGGPEDRWRLENVEGAGGSGVTPFIREALPPGSYLLEFTSPGRPQARLPILLSRGRSESLRVVLPQTVPEGYAYIPPGSFLFGSADVQDVRNFLHSPPLHHVLMNEGEGYVIARTEVTLGDWLAYVDGEVAQDPRQPVKLRLGTGQATMVLSRTAQEGWKFDFYRPQTVRAGGLARAGEDFRYPDGARSQLQKQDWRRFPLSGVAPKELQTYLGWLDRTGRLQGARFCSEYEWERAARGADDRIYPHGNRLEPDEANIDATYGRKDEAFGPDAVGSHPASVSPWGLLDMAGNAFEVTRTLDLEVKAIPFMLRGGSWYHDKIGTRVMNRTFGEVQLQDVTVGLRICASWPPR
jgi:serine/threonine protein kinase/formylglycine-generating enzyme required for sulfatase activity/cell division protein FtsB